MELAMIARLAGCAPIAAILASGEAVGWHERPASLGFPSISLTDASSGREYTHDGHDGLDRPRVQFDLCSLDAVTLIALRDAVRAEMEQARDIGAVRFHVAMEVSHFRPPPETLPDGKRVYRITQEWEFFWESVS
jgi:hypothetical protein